MSTTPKPWQVWLPMPPSTNNLYATARNGRRFTTSAYRTWKGEADSLVMMLGPRRAFDCPVKVTVALTPGPRCRRSDADNRLKAVQDCLVRMGILVDDDREFVHEITARWSNRGRPGALVTVTPISTAESANAKPAELACSTG
jgi:Holliday junction resolvase RusA-like endonuclease